MTSLNLRGIAIFEIETENEENGDLEYEQISISPNQVEWETEVHDADRQMGPEYVHIGTADVNGREVLWRACK